MFSYCSFIFYGISRFVFCFVIYGFPSVSMLVSYSFLFIYGCRPLSLSLCISLFRYLCISFVRSPVTYLVWFDVISLFRLVISFFLYVGMSSAASLCPQLFPYVDVLSCVISLWRPCFMY